MVSVFRFIVSSHSAFDNGVGVGEGAGVGSCKTRAILQVEPTSRHSVPDEPDCESSTPPPARRSIKGMGGIWYGMAKGNPVRWDAYSKVCSDECWFCRVRILECGFYPVSLFDHGYDLTYSVVCCWTIKIDSGSMAFECENFSRRKRYGSYARHETLRERTSWSKLLFPRCARPWR